MTAQAGMCPDVSRPIVKNKVLWLTFPRYYANKGEFHQEHPCLRKIVLHRTKRKDGQPHRYNGHRPKLRIHCAMDHRCQET
jgi:hypothetical protein